MTVHTEEYRRWAIYCATCANRGKYAECIPLTRTLDGISTEWCPWCGTDLPHDAPSRGPYDEPFAPPSLVDVLSPGRGRGKRAA